MSSLSKHKDFASFVEAYKPLRFKFMGVTRKESMPRETITDMPQLLRIHLKNDLNLPLNYFDLRSSLTSEGKKRADMAFLTHCIKKCDRDAEDASWSERIRFYRIWFRYLPELMHVNGSIGRPETNDYMIRWGYLLDHDPSFDELIHGMMDGEAALYALENLV